MMKLKTLCVVTLFLLCLYQNASAELAALGPVGTTNGFPSWYMDENGVALELCLTSGICAFDPLIGGNFFSQQIGFGEKAAYWSANALLTGLGAKGMLDMSLVASFSGNTSQVIPLNGEQITFFQIVVGPITGLTAGGIYTVTHPLGVIENLVADGLGIIPQQRQDIGCAIASASVPCNFSAVLGSPAGPFLKWDTGAPAGFIGDIRTAHTITGSPFNTNVFRIDGPNAGGSGVNTKEQNLFNVQGKLFTGLVPTPLIVNRSTYTRPLPNAVNVLATSAPSAILRVSGTGINTTMVGDGKGKFFAHIPLPGSLPEFITVTADNPPNTTATVISDVVDVVTITLAEYNSDLKTLTIKASSSDQVALPTLTALGFGNLVAGNLIVRGLLVPPPEVTVVSSAGGSDTTHVTVTANIKPIAQNDSGLTKKNTAVVINVLANDTAVSGTLDPATVTIVAVTGHGTTSVDPVTGKVTYTPNLDFVGKDSFTYTVDAVISIGTDEFNVTSNVATVNITVADETLSVTKAVFTRSSRSWQISGTSTVKTGNKITLYVGPDTTGPVIGTSTVNVVLGNWSFSKFFSSVLPGTATSITAVSTLGTTVTFPLTIK